MLPGVFPSSFNKSVIIPNENGKYMRVEACIGRCIQARDSDQNMSDIKGVQVPNPFRTNTSCKCFFNVTKVVRWRSCFFKGDFLLSK